MALLLMMKKVKDFKFTFKYAFKNIYFNKLKSLALVSIFIVIFVLSFLLFSLKGLIHNYYYHDLNNTYKNHDLVISVTENTNARFFSIRELEHEAINDITPLLKIQTLINFEEQAYVNVLAGDITALNKLNNYSSTSELLKNQMIVTKSLAQKLGLTKGDLVLLQLDSSQSFEVVEIINDDGLINGNTIYISKDANVDHILIALGLGNINPAVLNNIYNLVYLDVNDLNIVDEIQLINGFEN